MSLCPHKLKCKQMTYIFMWVTNSGKLTNSTKILITSVILNVGIKRKKI